MKTKPFFFLFFLGLIINAQTVDELKTNANKMFEFTSSMDFDKIMDYTYPKLFEIIDRETLVEYSKLALNSPELEMKIVPIDPNFEFGEIKKIDSAYYALIKHDLGMTMKMKKEIDDPEIFVGLMSAAMQTDDIYYDEEKQIYNITKRSEMVAVADSLTHYKWKFINNDSSSSYMLGLLIPEKAQTELGLIKNDTENNTDTENNAIEAEAVSVE